MALTDNYNLNNIDRFVFLSVHTVLAFSLLSRYSPLRRFRMPLRRRRDGTYATKMPSNRSSRGYTVIVVGLLSSRARPKRVRRTHRKFQTAFPIGTDIRHRPVVTYHAGLPCDIPGESTAKCARPGYVLQRTLSACADRNFTWVFPLRLRSRRR